MKYGAGGITATTDAFLIGALEKATQFVEQGNVLVGWTNQLTKTGQLAIGGGVAAQVQPASQVTMINEWVTRLFFQ
jgi:hypothetical protein